MDGLPSNLQEGIRYAVKATASGERLLLNVALNYGGRMEIVRAIQRMMEDNLSPADITEPLVSDYLFTSGIPDPDLIIRTAGEMRLSNFLLWQSAYSEFWSTPVLWPDFSGDELFQALVVLTLAAQLHRQTVSQEGVAGIVCQHRFDFLSPGHRARLGMAVQISVSRDSDQVSRTRLSDQP
jgi:undecaprenyl diphosphate synthase